MAEPAKRNATYDDLRALPEGVTGEIIFGALYVHPSPAPPHGSAQFSLSSELGGPFQKGRGGPGGWWFMIQPELHLGPHILQPDIAGWRQERMPRLPATAFVDVSPDWVCEILSPSTEGIDRGTKRRIYATCQVSRLWYLHPIARYLEVSALRDGAWILVDTFSETEEFRAPPFDAVAFRLADLCPMPPPEQAKPQI
jgi:Uma2 family endonuclease